MRCLVTGGCGFIGSHIVEALIAEGHAVVVLDDFSTGNPDNLSAVSNCVRIIKGDIRNPEEVQRAAQGAEIVFHEAALVSVPGSIADPEANNAINITGTLNVLVAARDAGARRLVFASSAAIYGDNPVTPKTEDLVPEPKSPYALAKLTGEHYLRNFSELFGLETVALRYFNVYGPRQDPGSPYSGVISRFADAIAQGQTPTVLGDGRQTRDFVFVTDVAQANLQAAFSPTAGHGECLNIGTETPTAIIDLIDMIADIRRTSVTPEFGPERPGDVRHSLAAIEKAKCELNYAPTVDIKSGLEQLLNSLDR